MEITYESICKKLGYDLISKVAERNAKCDKEPWLIDDSQPRLCAGLSDEEIRWVLDNHILDGK